MRCMQMTEELILQLIAAGLSKQQARSAVAEKITNYYMNDDGKILIAEAKRQVDEMRSVLDDLKRDYYELKQAMQTVSEAILGIREAQGQYGEVTDDKAKNVLRQLLDEDQRVLKSPEPFIELGKLNSSSVDITVRAWVNSADYWPTFFSMNEKVYKTFAKEGLNIPFPQMDVHMKS